LDLFDAGLYIPSLALTKSSYDGLVINYYPVSE